MQKLRTLYCALNFLCVYQFVIHNFCGYATYIIHSSNPVHLIIRFELFKYSHIKQRHRIMWILCRLLFRTRQSAYFIGYSKHPYDNPPFDRDFCSRYFVIHP